jgi:hypothetical protein
MEIFLLCVTPLIDPSSSDGDEQIKTIEASLERIDLIWDDVIFILADNTAVNPSIARKVGCASHRLALGVKRMLKTFRKESTENDP